jgi:predicted dehydrogenase
MQALSDAGQNIVAVCDVDWRHAAGTFRRYPKARQYKDWRQMLDKEDKNIDAVVVSTADHCHAIVSIAAMKRGKHVYCEKPLTHSVYEAREMTKAAREYKVATQMGNGGQANEETRLMSEYIWAGAIGAVREVHIWTDRPNNGVFGEYWPQGVDRPKDAPPIPDTLDWDTWLGPAPERPYNPAYLPFKWRGWWDFGTGALGDIGCHSFDPAVRALKLGAPLTVEACSTRVNKETYPLGSIVTYQFPARGDMPELKFVWYDGGLKPPRPEGMDEGWQMGTNGKLFIGDKGIMSEHVLMPKSRREEFGKPEKVLPRSPGHYEEWIHACKGGKPAGSNFDHAGPMTETVLLGNVALRMDLRERLMREKLVWDSEKMQFTNVPEANQYLHTEYRKGWSL